MNQPSCFSSKTSFLPVITALLSFVLPLTSAHAQNVIAEGTTLKISAGTTLVSSANMVIKRGSALDNAGTLVLKQSLVNEHVSPNQVGTGTAEFAGAASQTLSGQSVFQNLVVNNPDGVAMDGNTTVNGALALTNGKVTLGPNNFSLGSSAFISGTPSASALLIVTGSGELRKEFPAGFAGSFSFPVGDDASTQEYSPVTMNITGGTMGPGNYIGVSLRNEMYPDPDIEGNYLNRYWNLSQYGISGLTCNATFQYLPADVVGTESELSATMVNVQPWITYGPAGIASHTLTATGIVAFGSFTGLKSTITPQNQALVNVIIPNGMTTCYDATQTLTVAGGGTTFLVEDNGSVTMVAGSRISMLDGTKVSSGGYLLGRITTTGAFCGTTPNPLVAVNPVEQAVGMETKAKSQFIRVYPNPTTDMVIVEFADGPSSLPASLTVYTMHGEKLFTKDLRGDTRFRFSLSDRPVGLYMIRVRTGDRTEIAKIVKN